MSGEDGRQSPEQPEGAEGGNRGEEEEQREEGNEPVDPMEEWEERAAELRKYYIELTFDPETAHRLLLLTEDDRKVEQFERDEDVPQNAKRFGTFQQVMCSQVLNGRCYWEVEIEGGANIGVTYRDIKRIGDSLECKLGGNDRSWALICLSQRYYVYHSNEKLDGNLFSNRVGVYLDRPAGTLSFYSVSPGIRGSNDRVTHIKTFQTTFDEEDLLPGFGFLPSGPQGSLCLLSNVP